MIYYVILIIMTIVGSIASFYLKKSTSSKGIYKLLMNKYLYLGGLLYFISAIMNIFVLQYLEYSVVLPLTSITYIWTMLISYYKLNEILSTKKILGICAILIGAVFVVL
ncbi:MAG: EamA family transporter [Anaerocolumna aminovalerica]|uniref:EamA family transporter n=1 Tax=Anaerocolumna aminovalerica TaxID=1527 RepID=UPI002911AC09|nr:EamA family transporter [Anaerocolumna aminovalerica]MDU6265995.1 EamA family transporter [Anaerocolumna aminovalerica]